MITRYRVSLDGYNLDAIAPEIMILDVAYTVPPFAQQMSTLPGRDGQIPHGRFTLQTAGVTVTIEIHTQDIRRRQEVAEQVRRWAMKGGKLRVNSRPHEFLRVRCDRPPVVPSDLKWTGKITVGFAADEIVYWMDEDAQKVSVQPGKSAALYVPGSAYDTPVSVEVQNNSGQTVNTMSVTAGDTVFSFANLALASGQALTIGYDETDILYIRAGEVSKMNKRTPESSDELRIRQNEHVNVSVTADAAVTAVFTARGRSL